MGTAGSHFPVWGVPAEPLRVSEVGLCGMRWGEHKDVYQGASTGTRKGGSPVSIVTILIIIILVLVVLYLFRRVF